MSFPYPKITPQADGTYMAHASKDSHQSGLTRSDAITWITEQTGETVNYWGTPKADINSEEFCPDCEREYPHHYASCPRK